MTILPLIKRTALFQDEALNYMKQIQQFQEQQPNWQQLPQEERQTNENQVTNQTYYSDLLKDNNSISDFYLTYRCIFCLFLWFCGDDNSTCHFNFDNFQYHHTGRLARYHNIMGLETIQVLDKLTSEIRSVFLHPTMVDRIAAMLNYFLKNLVGPERKSFKVWTCCSRSYETYET